MSYRIPTVMPLLLLTFCALGCGGDDLSGHWCAKRVTRPESCDALYLDVSEDDEELSGQFCEKYGSNCNPLINGKVEGSIVTFSYNIGNTDRADADLGWNLENTELSGTLYSTRCDCKIPLFLYRI
ncbi:MAG: hypothetical protein KC503_31485 [Myxococcales bacterium]|nr:hypothetical protein [Myxococcales bacterium]